MGFKPGFLANQMISDKQFLKDLESSAVEIAWGAGAILKKSFGRQIAIEYKDKNKLDPVTEVDRDCQRYLVEEINRRYPSHGILGEETPEPTETGNKANQPEQSAESKGPDELDELAADFLWILDPLDGTTNYLNGLPVFACSIGIVHKGAMVAGALYLPWPNQDGGFVLHCHRGGGSFADGEPVSVYQSDQPVGNRLVGLPGSFGQLMRFGKGVKGHRGEPRTTGSIAYELAMTSCGVMQYAVFGAPRMWDMAAGALAVQEAGGTVMARLPGVKEWKPLESLVPAWETKSPSIRSLRAWTAPLVAGNQQVAPLLAENLKSRFRPMAKLRYASRRIARKLKPGGSSSST